MVFDMTDPYCTLVLRGIENSLYQSSFLPILTDVHNERSRFERYLEMLLDRRVEGLIVVANWLFLDINCFPTSKKAAFRRRSSARELKTEQISSVIVDNELGAQLAVEHLHSLGHRKIAFIRGPKALVDSAPRWKGIRTFAKSSGLELDPRLIVDLPESRDPISSFEAGYKLTEELIKQKRPFTAILAFDDMTAFGAIRALAKAGLRVPEHCSVIGFDDVATSAFYTPAAHHHPPAYGSNGSDGGRPRGGRHQRRARKTRSFRPAPQDCPRTGGAGIHPHLLASASSTLHIADFLLDMRNHIKALFTRFNKSFH